MPKLSELSPAAAGQPQRLVAVQGAAQAYSDALLPLDPSLSTASGSLAVAFGAAAGTAAEGNDPRIGGALQAANNLSEIRSAPNARSNLGLGSIATLGSTVGGDLLGTLPNPTVAKINGQTPAPSATTDTTNAANISAGTLPAARLPSPSASTLGGVESYIAPAHQFLTGISTAGVPQSAQPTANDISGLAASATTDTTNAANIGSGTLAAARLPAPTASTLGGVESFAAQSHKFLTQIGTDGSVSGSQPAASDVLGLAVSATTDTTNAANISSGTLADARLPGTISAKTFSGVNTQQKAVQTTGIVVTWLANNQVYQAADGDGGVMPQAGTTPTIRLPANPANGYEFVFAAGVATTYTFATIAPSAGGAAPTIYWHGASPTVMNPGDHIIFRYRTEGGTPFWVGCSSLTDASAISSGTLAVARGGTGQSSLTAHGVLIGEGTSAIAATAAMTAGQLLVGQGSSADPTPQTVSGDGTLSSAGALTVTKTSGVAFAASATTDTTNASNISSGTLAVARGGTGVGTLAAHGVLLGEGTGNVVATAAGSSGQLLIGQGASSDPAFTAMSGDATITNAGTITVTKTSGTAFAASATTDTTNASNISSGTLNANRLPGTINATTVSGILTTSSGRVIALRRVTASGAITLTSSDDTVVAALATPAAIAVNLPSSPAAGQEHTIKDGIGNAATNTLTITPAAGNIDGAATFVMNVNWQSVTVRYDGTQWVIV